MSNDDTEDLSNKKFRQTRAVDQGLRQFLKLETGLGNSAAFQRGHVWNFQWCPDLPWRQGKPALVQKVSDLMAAGKTFEEAFDEVAYHEQTHR